MKVTNNGTIRQDVWMIIPFLLFISKAKITNLKETGGGYIYAVHITPWVAFGFTRRWKA
jgi:hypothetical protein